MPFKTPPNHKAKIEEWIAFEGQGDRGYVNTSAPESAHIQSTFTESDNTDTPSWANYRVYLRAVDELIDVKYAETEQGSWVKAKRLVEEYR